MRSQSFLLYLAAAVGEFKTEMPMWGSLIILRLAGQPNNWILSPFRSRYFPLKWSRIRFFLLNSRLKSCGRRERRGFLGREWEWKIWEMQSPSWQFCTPTFYKTSARGTCSFYKGKDTPYNLSQDLWNSAGCVVRKLSGKACFSFEISKSLGRFLERGIECENQNAILKGHAIDSILFAGAGPLASNGMLTFPSSVLPGPALRCEAVRGPFWPQ